MVRLNKTPLTKKQTAALFLQLSTTIGKQTGESTDLFLSELLGTEERIMLAKRLAILILLVEETSLYKISNTLKVSPATAKKIKWEMEAGDFDHIIRAIGKNKRAYFSILEALDSILHLGGILPHYNGLDRYKHLN